MDKQREYVMEIIKELLMVGERKTNTCIYIALLYVRTNTYMYIHTYIHTYIALLYVRIYAP